MPETPDDSYREKNRDDDYRRRDDDYGLRGYDNNRGRRDDDDYRRRDDYDDDYGRGRRRDYVEPHRGVMILVFGILGIMVCGVFAPIAWAMGSADLKAIEAGRVDREGEGMTRAGYILGIIGSIIMIIGLLFSCLWFIVIAAARH